MIDMETMFGPEVELPTIDPAIRDMHEHRTANPVPLKRINDVHREIMRLAATGLYNHNEIAEAVGVRTGTVTKILNVPITQDYLVALRMRRDNIVLETRDILAERVKEVAEAIVDIALDKEANIHARIKAMDSTLDRVGVARTSESKSTITENKHTTIEHIKQMAEEQADNPNVRAILNAKAALEGQFRVVEPEESECSSTPEATPSPAPSAPAP